jgi:hypothetical protein
MTLGQSQRVFTRNIGCLIEYAYSIGIELTFGEAQRTPSQVLLNYFGYDVVLVDKKLVLKKRKPTSKTLESNHPDRLAVDFNFFINGKLTYRYEDVKPLGDYWVSLHDKNRWGGDFNKNGIADGFMDTPHFEMQR